MTAWLEFLFEILGFAVDAAGPDSSGKPRPRKRKRSHMPLIPIQDLPDNARAWVFGADRTLDASTSELVLNEVDSFLAQWKAHGSPLTVGRDWKYGRFLTVAVDQSTAGASGCSIDGLFRTLKALEPKLGGSLVTSGLIFFRDDQGAIQSVDREQFAALARDGKITSSSRVFDPTVTTLGEWRARFQLNAEDSWHSKLLGKKQPA